MTNDPMFTMETTEIAALNAALATVQSDETVGGCLWLTVDDNRRLWVADGNFGRVTVTVHEAHETTVDGWLAVPDRAVRFAAVLDPDPVTISLVDGAIVTANDTMSSAIDLVAEANSPPETSTRGIEAWANVPVARFAAMLFAARIIPSGANDLEFLPPPMWLRLGNGQVTLHVDWSDLINSKSTFRLEAETFEGEAIVAIGHYTIGSFLQHLPLNSDEVTITVGIDERDGHERPAVWLDTPNWSLTSWTVNPLIERWSALVNAACQTAGFPIVDHDTTQWLVRAEECDVRVTLHHGHPDIARVSTTVVDNVAATAELLDELNSLNISASNIRFFWIEGVVHATADVRCTEIAGLTPVIREVALNARRYCTLLGIYASRTQVS